MIGASMLKRGAHQALSQKWNDEIDKQAHFEWQAPMLLID
jgi:hypothetical protein